MDTQREVKRILDQLTLDHARELDEEEEKRRKERKEREKEEQEKILEQLESQFMEIIVPETARTEEEFRRQFIGVGTPEEVEARPRITQAEESFRQRFIGGE